LFEVPLIRDISAGLPSAVQHDNAVKSLFWLLLPFAIFPSGS